MLIFDSFKTRQAAADFAGKVFAENGLSVYICNSHGEANHIDPFPFELLPPIVMVARAVPDSSGLIGLTDEQEDAVKAAATESGARFAGT